MLFIAKVVFWRGQLIARTLAVRHAGFLTELDVLTPDELDREPTTATFSVHLARMVGRASQLKLSPLPVFRQKGKVLAANSLIEALSGYVLWRAHDRVSMKDKAADHLLTTAMGLRRCVGAWVMTLYLTGAALSQTLAPPTSAKTIPDWYQRGVMAAMLDPTPGVLAAVMDLPRADDAFDATRTGDPDQRKAVVEALLKLAASPDSNVQQSAAAALFEFGPIGANQVAYLLAQIGQDVDFRRDLTQDFH